MAVESQSPETIPIIDLSPVVTAQGSDAAVIRAVEAACRNTGFFLVTGHGVPQPVTKALYDTARVFFDEPQDWKVSQGQGRSVTGGVSFSPIAEEALAATQGEKTPGDMKESLNFGPLLGGGSWPERPAGLKEAFAGYFREMEVLSARLRRIFCAAIGVPEDHFEPAFEDHLSALRVINYPAQERPPEPGQLRAGVHTDYGFITILRSEASPGGLQVRRRDGKWIDAPAMEGAYVVNIGDALMRWTNDQWISTPHRVANPPEGSGAQSRRQSIPFFLNPSSETMIDCLPAFAGGGAKYAPISFSDYIAMKTEQAFGKA